MLIPLDRSRPLGDQLYLFVRESILAGRLAPGTRLPSSRRVAEDHGVARNTVVAAYDRLRAEGYLDTAGARGTRVSGTLPLLPQAPRRTPNRGGASAKRRRPPLSAHAHRLLKHPDSFPPAARRRPDLPWDFQYNVNVSDAASRRAWHRLFRRHAARHEHAAAPYDLSGNPIPLQESIAAYLARTRGVHCSADQVVLINSFQQAFQLAARLLMEPGDTVAMEDPHRLGARNAFLADGLRVRPVRTDEDGLRPDDLPRDGSVRLLYVSPSHSWPHGHVLALTRRLEILNWARRNGAWILENDHNSEYGMPGTPQVSVKGLDEAEGVLYVGTFSRLISPEPEIAYVVVPRDLILPFRAARTLESYACPLLETEALTDYLEEGHVEALVRRAVRRLRPLRDTLVDELRRQAIPKLEIAPGRNGLQVHVTLGGWSAAQTEALARSAAEQGVGVFPDAPYYLRPRRPAGLILGFAAMTPDRIREGIRRFARVAEKFRRDAC